MAKAAVLVPELLRNLVERPVTRLYPFEKVHVPAGFRGVPRFTPETCSGCKVCVRDCPSEAIEIHVETLPAEPGVEGQPSPKPKRKMSMVLYLDRCVHCGRCAEVCPRGSIILDDEFESAAFSRDTLRLVTK
jgi:formate hydrogenlyase subunit 6/NADH:ubiquinone oxidoreductase subunit I